MYTRKALRYCVDIGMFAIDRGASSCKHATSFCRAHCYNLKLYEAFGHCMKPRDVFNERYWEKHLNGKEIAIVLDRKNTRQTRRIRLMTRGEAFKTVGDVAKVEEILRENPNRLVWIPTRAWRDATIRRELIRLKAEYPNARIMASIDPSNTDAEIEQLKAERFSTMYFGDDSATNGRVLCEKTWEKKNGHCATCENGCFSSEQVHVHLKSH